MSSKFDKSTIETVLKELGLSDIACHVYLGLLEIGPCSARLLSHNVGVPRSSIYDHLKSLIQLGLILELDQGKKVFQVEDVKKLTEMIRSRIDSLKQSEKDIEQLLPILIPKTQN